MKKMLFETNLSGHRLEYIHHIYMGMARYIDTEFVIVVPKEFEEKKSLYKWLEARNITFRFLSDEEIKECGGGLLKGAWRKTKLLMQVAKETKSDRVFLITLMEFIPFLPLMMPRKIAVSGIIYMIYLYRWRTTSWKTRLGDVLKYLLISGRNCIQNVFVLNDASAARRFNNLYHTRKFCYLPDPYNAQDYTPKDVRNELGIPAESKMFLHFGGLTRRKGTMTILEAVNSMTMGQRSAISIVFAGRVYDDIHDAFFRKIGELQKSVNIRVYDKFCSNEFLADLCKTSDVILLPYASTCQSSGVLGHAAYYGKPVIGPAEGLVGKIIRKRGLGIAIEHITPQTLADVMVRIDKQELLSSYKDATRVDRFIGNIFERL